MSSGSNHIEAQIGEAVIKTLRECSDRYASTGKVNISVKFVPDHSLEPVERSIIVNLSSLKGHETSTTTPPGMIASEPLVMVPLTAIQIESPPVDFLFENLEYTATVESEDSDPDTEMTRVSPPPQIETGQRTPNQKSTSTARARKVFKENGVYHCGFPGCGSTANTAAKVYRHRYVGHETPVRCPQRGCNKQFYSRKGLTKHLTSHRTRAVRRDSSLGRDKVGSEKMLRPRNIAIPRESSSALGKVVRKKKQLTRSRTRRSRVRNGLRV